MNLSTAPTAAPTTLPPVPTSRVGSHPQPDWLIDPTNVGARFPPRMRDQISAEAAQSRLALGARADLPRAEFGRS